jgi:PPE-repeat protein
MKFFSSPSTFDVGNSLPRPTKVSGGGFRAFGAYNSQLSGSLLQTVIRNQFFDASFSVTAARARNPPFGGKSFE